MFLMKELNYVIRTAKPKDAKELSELRMTIDGETENLDRGKGEGLLSAVEFEQLIGEDHEKQRHLLLVAEVGNRLAGFSRCEGSELKRIAHRVEFGIGVLREYWGFGIGKNLLKESILWADDNGINKISLKVLETNEKAIKLYQNHGFEKEGLLKKDKILSDGNFYNTILMARFN